MSQATMVGNGNGTEYSVREDLRRALAEVLVEGPEKVLANVPADSEPVEVESLTTTTSTETIKPNSADRNTIALGNDDDYPDADPCDKCEAKPEEEFGTPSLLFDVPVDEKPLFHKSRDFVVMRGLSINTAIRIMADLNRPWLNCYRVDHPWHCVAPMGKAWGVVRVMVRMFPAHWTVNWRPRSVLEFPANIEWRTKAEINALNKAKPDNGAETVVRCVKLLDAECPN